MELPNDVRMCLDKLEAAGYAAYLVGGCVRDSVLGLQPHDYDLCTAAAPEQIKAVFADHRLVLAGEKHGTVSVVCGDGLVEITTFRTEGGYRDNRHPDWVKFVPRVEEDLARRDFTVNAMACSPARGFADPFGGRQDLAAGVLRAVGDPNVRFREDALRILRGVRFAVRFRLTPEAETEKAMRELASLMDGLARERVFEELCKLLPLVTAEDLRRFAPILAQVIPELEPTIGFDQRSPHHAFDLFTHIAHVTETVSGDLSMRWAALLHDIGKIPTFTQDETGRGHFKGHAEVGAEMADQVLRRLRAPTALRERVVLLIRKHMTPLEPDRKLLRRRLGSLGHEAVWQLLELQRADFGSKGTGASEDDSHFDRVEEMLREIESEELCLKVTDLAISGRDLQQIGYAPNKALGECLNRLLEMVQAEELENFPAALMDAAAKMLKQQEYKGDLL